MSRHREIRSEGGRQLQGLRAGFVSRAVASGTDVVLVLCIYVVAVILVSIAWDLFFSSSISVASPPHWVNELLVWILLVVYLTGGWWSTGRTLGKQMLGLRVVRSDGRSLRFWRALFRAVLCASFFPALLLALVNRRNRGLEDVAFRTVVIYDWLPSYGSLAEPSMETQPMIEIRPSSVPIVPS